VIHVDEGGQADNAGVRSGMRVVSVAGNTDVDALRHHLQDAENSRVDYQIAFRIQEVASIVLGTRVRTLDGLKSYYGRAIKQNLRGVVERIDETGDAEIVFDGAGRELVRKHDFERLAVIQANDWTTMDTRAFDSAMAKEMVPNPFVETQATFMQKPKPVERQEAVQNGYGFKDLGPLGETITVPPGRIDLEEFRRARQQQQDDVFRAAAGGEADLLVATNPNSPNTAFEDLATAMVLSGTAADLAAAALAGRQKVAPSSKAVPALDLAQGRKENAQNRRARARSKSAAAAQRPKAKNAAKRSSPTKSRLGNA
jgi:hypothetical protein